LTDAHEANRAEPWSVSDAPADFIDRMVAGIVGFGLAITSIQGKWKMSQNRTPADMAAVREALAREDSDECRAVAAQIQHLRP
jgi:transcriptional regulator